MACAGEEKLARNIMWKINKRSQEAMIIFSGVFVCSSPPFLSVLFCRCLEPITKLYISLS